MYKVFDKGESEVFQVFKVSEIAKKLGKTKDSVYKKSSRLKHELDGHKKKLNGIIYYDEEGFEIIKNSYDIPIVDEEPVQSVQSRQHFDDNKYLELLLSEKEKQIEHLKEHTTNRNSNLAPNSS